MSAQHTPGSIAALAYAAQMMPWEKTATDVPLSARWAFQQAITADHYIEVLEALCLAVRQNSHDMALTGEELRACEAAIAKATGSTA